MTELNLVLVSRMLPRFRAGLKALKFKDNTVKYYCGCITFLMCCCRAGMVLTPMPV
jgi:hypothetical protein